MKKYYVTTILLATLCCFAAAQEADETVRIWGKVTDFNGEPVAGATIMLKAADSFRDEYVTRTDSQGCYELMVNKGSYMVMFIMHRSETGMLDHDVWNFLAYKDMEINPTAGPVQLYSMGAFQVRGSNVGSLFIFFRPVDTTKLKPEIMERVDGVSDVAPKLKIDDVSVLINGEEIEIYEVTRMREATQKGEWSISYLVQTASLRGFEKGDILRITVTVKDNETGVQGQGTVFYEKQ